MHISVTDFELSSMNIGIFGNILQACSMYRISANFEKGWGPAENISRRRR
jgi:hypothetical protein